LGETKERTRLISEKAREVVIVRAGGTASFICRRANPLKEKNKGMHGLQRGNGFVIQ